MRWVQRARREGIASLATALALTCGGDDDGPSGNSGSIHVAVSPIALSLPQGGSGSVTASLTRVGGFSGAVTLAVTGLPQGAAATITPAQLSGNTANATVEVTLAATVPVGNYAAVVTATAQGVAQASATYQLNVTTLPNYALTVAPAALTIPAGGNGGATINIERTNFTGGVTLALVNPPAGITGAFNPTPSTTNAAGLAISVAPNVAPGTHPITIQGTAVGAGVKTASLTLTATAPPTGGSNVEYQFCDASQVPVFFAFQDGTNGWQAVTPTTSSGVTRFTFRLTQGRGGALMVFRYSTSIAPNVATFGSLTNSRPMHGAPLGSRERMRARFGAAAARGGALHRSSVADVYATEVRYGSTADLTQDGIDNCAQTAPTKSVIGTIAGLGTGQLGIFSLGSATETFPGGSASSQIIFSSVPPGPVDFVGVRMSSAGGPPNKAVVFRNLNVPDGGSLPSIIDFNGPASSIPATANVTILGGQNDDLEVFTEFLTSRSRMLFWFDLSPSPTALRQWAGLAPSVMASGDFHGLFVFASPPTSSREFRVALKFVGPVDHQSLALGPTVATASATPVVAGVYPRYRFQGLLPNDYSKGIVVDLSQDTGNAFSIIATSTYLATSGGSLAYDFTMPDVFGLAGFPAVARVQAGTNAVTVSGFGFTGPGIFDLTPTLGGEFKAAVRANAVNVP
jgi:hypothetical protein